MNLPRLTHCAVILALSSCAAAPTLPPVEPYSAAELGTVRYKAVLAAGDSSLPVFDNAVAAVADRLRASERMAGITRLSATPALIEQSGVRSASLDHILDAISGLKPDVGQGCLVFVTSHGAPYRGLYLSSAGEMLSPHSLDRALVQGCGNAPTVVVASGCFSGTFAQPPMARTNRVILTAARADRVSFGCGAGFTYTVYDRCLLGSLDKGGTWQDAAGAIKACVEQEERRQGVTPSLPQTWFGSAVRGLPMPGIKHQKDMPLAGLADPLSLLQDASPARP